MMCYLFEVEISTDSSTTDKDILRCQQALKYGRKYLELPLSAEKKKDTEEIIANIESILQDTINSKEKKERQQREQLQHQQDLERRQKQSDLNFKKALLLLDETKRMRFPNMPMSIYEKKLKEAVELLTNSQHQYAEVIRAIAQCCITDALWDYVEMRGAFNSERKGYRLNGEVWGVSAACSVIALNLKETGDERKAVDYFIRAIHSNKETRWIENQLVWLNCYCDLLFSFDEDEAMERNKKELSDWFHKKEQEGAAKNVDGASANRYYNTLKENIYKIDHPWKSTLKGLFKKR